MSLPSADTLVQRARPWQFILTLALLLCLLWVVFRWQLKRQSTVDQLYDYAQMLDIVRTQVQHETHTTPLEPAFQLQILGTVVTCRTLQGDRWATDTERTTLWQHALRDSQWAELVALMSQVPHKAFTQKDPTLHFESYSPIPVINYRDDQWWYAAP